MNEDFFKKLWPRMILWLMSATALYVAFFSVKESFSFNLEKFAVLVVAVLISFLLSDFESKLPRSSLTFSPNRAIMFWGIMWLGVPGGVLLGLVLSLVYSLCFGFDKRSFVSRTVADFISVFVAAIAYSAAFLYFKPSVEQNQSNPFLAVLTEIGIAAGMMLVVHYVVHSMLTLLLSDSNDLRTRDFSVGYIGGFLFNRAAEQLMNFATALLLLVATNHFGIEFGLVIIPVAVLANVAFRLHSRGLEQHTKQISEASRLHLATVEALATAIDAREQGSIGHVRRTQIYSVELGKILGLPEADIDALRMGALLHDIGNLAVPDHILNKQGRLTATEEEKAKVHASVGASILETVGFSYPVVPTVKHHHEWWDGTGYPEGLRGTMIPLTSRILTVCDSYDTMRCPRSFREAFLREDACNFLRKESGTKFDPHIVRAFLKNLSLFDRLLAAEGVQYPEDGVYRSAKPKVIVETPQYVDQIKRANQEVSTLYSLARGFSSSLNLSETLSLFAMKVGDFVPYDTCSIYLLDDGGSFATAFHVEGKNKEVLEGKRVMVGEGATGRALETGKPIENVNPALDFSHSLREYCHEYKTMAAFPLIIEERVIGAISLYTGSLSKYQVEHLRLLETVSTIAADAISNALLHSEAESSALTDPMTGLPNARSLQLQFEKELGRSMRSDQKFQVLVLDFDGFKAVNDTFGHKVGDRMLKEVSKIIRGQLRDYDFLGRYGGDEFIAIVPDTDSANVTDLCQRIESAVGAFELPVQGDVVAKIGVSIGAACYPDHGRDFDQLIHTADQAMYRIKAHHKRSKAAKSLETLVPIVVTEKETREAFEVNGYEIFPIEVPSEDLIVELDESNIMSSSNAVN